MITIRSIPVPGNYRISSPNARILGDKDTPLTLTVSYHFYPDGAQDRTERPIRRFGEISFTPLIGFRFCWSELVYDEFPEIYEALIANIGKGNMTILVEKFPLHRAHAFYDLLQPFRKSVGL